jgi:hypothetical protein
VGLELRIPAIFNTRSIVYYNHLVLGIATEHPIGIHVQTLQYIAISRQLGKVLLPQLTASAHLCRAILALPFASRRYQLLIHEI